MPRVVVVATSPRVPPGLLSWSAWQVLHEVTVCTADPLHPQAPFLLDAGVGVEVLERVDDESLAAQLVAREDVAWLSAGAPDAGLVRVLGLRAVRGSGIELEVLHGSYDPPGARVLDVVAVMDRLRSPGGCPWDAQQSHVSLMPYLLEEAYEAYAALEQGDAVGLREELGDVLLQVAFHARLGEEADPPWSIDDVAGDLVDKLVRRHPHVFGPDAAGTASVEDLEGSWEALKAAEKGRTSVTEGVPLSQPALSLASKLQRRAVRLGAPVASYDGFGGQLWDLVARCREAGLDPEVELRTVARDYRDRLAGLETAVRAEGADPADLTPEQWRSRL